MILATVSPGSCFCCLYRVSPTLAAKNIINLILVLTIWWCPCVESSLVLFEEGVFYGQCVLLAKLCYPWPCFILYSQAKLAVTPVLSWHPTFAFQSPIMKRNPFWVLVLKGLLGLHRTVQLQLVQHYWLGHRTWITVIVNGLPWKQRSFCCFWDCVQVLHFRLFCGPWWLLHFFQGILAHSSRYNIHLS